MTRSGPTLEPPLALWIPSWALGIGLLLWPQPALASGFDAPQWVGAGIALGLFLLVVLAATWVLRKPSPADMESGTGRVLPGDALAPTLPTPTDFSHSRLGRLQQGIARRRRALKEGKRGFPGDTEVMARFREGCGRMQRGEAPPVPPERQLPPGTLIRLSRLYDQLLSAKPARARDWPLQRASLSSQIRTTLGQRDTNRLLELLDGLAKRRAARQQPTQREAADWREFLGQFRDTPEDPAPLSSSPDDELAVAEDVPTSDLLSLDPTSAEADAPTVGADTLLPGRASPASEEDAPTVDTDTLFPGRASPASEEDAPTVDTDTLFPGRASPASEEDAPTVDTDTLFPARPAAEEIAPAEAAREELPLAEEDAPTVDTENLFPTRKISVSEDEEYPEDDAPTIDTLRLFKSSSPSANEGDPVTPPGSTGRRKRRGAKPPRASFSETDALLDPVEDAPTRDTADLFPKE